MKDYKWAYFSFESIITMQLINRQFPLHSSCPAVVALLANIPSRESSSSSPSHHNHRFLVNFERPMKHTKQDYHHIHTWRPADLAEPLCIRDFRSSAR